LGCAAAVAALRAYKSLQASGALTRQTAVFHEHLSGLAAEWVESISTAGLLAAVALRPVAFRAEDTAPDTPPEGYALTACVKNALLEHGVTAVVRGRHLYLAPAFNLAEADLARGLDLVSRALGTLASQPLAALP
jgi:adenosylmethionine-8-amino-7-oxononanoate aminotransferase